MKRNLLNPFAFVAYIVSWAIILLSPLALNRNVESKVLTEPVDSTCFQKLYLGMDEEEAVGQLELLKEDFKRCFRVTGRYFRTWEGKDFEITLGFSEWIGDNRGTKWIGMLEFGGMRKKGSAIVEQLKHDEGKFPHWRWAGQIRKFWGFPGEP